MSGLENPCLSLAIARLSAAGTDNFAIWVLKAPYPGGYVHHDSTFPQAMTQTWLSWQEMFVVGGLPHVPFSHHLPLSSPTNSNDSKIGFSSQEPSYSGRLMQHLGIDLWSWLFDAPIQNALAESRGIARGQNKPLRLRLEIRDPDLIPLPWEIMQPTVGQQAISLSQQLLFSRTTSIVDPLKPFTHSHQSLNILLVLGQDNQTTNHLQLEQEAIALEKVLKAVELSNAISSEAFVTPVSSHVDTLLEPTPAQLIETLENGDYNILFYAGHGEPGLDGGLLFLHEDAAMNGTELAQVLVRTQVTLAVFNACWGAQSDKVGSQAVSRSSLAEVLIHHGVPAVLGMRDSIADHEALSFIQALAQALALRMPIDQAVAVARQKLLTLYKFNQPAWTLPVLYMHPEFEGELIKPIEEGITELPSNTLPGWVRSSTSVAFLRSLSSTAHVWQIRGGLMRVGRRQENDLVIGERWVSQQHAEIICRDQSNVPEAPSTYFLRDFSRYGTLLLSPDSKSWQKIHHQEVQLQSGVQLKFGSTEGQALEFIIETLPTSDL
ncbi:MAG: CHAT domain-containing protein [Symploca sp. SIO1B1]|nr:CHAT domain-containing protein [Symploca sp. SIO1B1]